MMKNQSKVGYVAITILMGLIIVSFALTGFQDFIVTADKVAVVDGEPIQVRDYRRQLNSQLSMYSQQFGGKSLTTAQIKAFGIRERVLDQLINSKLLLNYADELALAPGINEIKQEIKELPYFQTDNKFDLSKYRQAQNNPRFNAGQFEEDIASDIKRKKLLDLFQAIKPSRAQAKDRLEIKSKEAQLLTVNFNKKDMVKNIEVTKKEISEFVGNKDNKTKLEGLFKTAKSEFNTPEKVKARHILLKTDGKKDEEVLAKAKKLRKKLTVKNFKKIANKETQDPSGKSNGGDLGEFSKGRMVPPFEKAAFSMKPGTISQPVKTTFGYHIIYVEKKIKAVEKKLADVQDILAERYLQKNKTKELEDFNFKLKADLENFLKENKVAEIKKLQKKYGVSFSDTHKVNPLNTSIPRISIDKKEILKVLTAKDTNTVLTNDENDVVALVKVKSFSDKKVEDKDIDSELKSMEYSLNNGLIQEVIDTKRNAAKIVTYTDNL